MKSPFQFQLTVQRRSLYNPKEKGFELVLENTHTGETVPLILGKSMEELKLRGSDLFNGEPHLAGKRIHWRDSDDLDYDSCEYFTL
jgi:hypothetical protein